MAYTKIQLESLKNTLLASAQPDKINATKHRQFEQAIIDELFDSQTRANLLSELDELLSLMTDDKVVLIRNGAAYLVDVSLLQGSITSFDELAWKQPVKVATTANITLSGEQTIDGVLTSGSRVLVKDQSTGSQNGIYVSSAGAWSRATDANTAAELEGAAVLVQEGTAGGNKIYLQTADGITLGSTSLVFTQISGGGLAWGTITGTLSDQTDLQAELDDKLDSTTTYRSPITGAHTLDATDLAAVNSGKQWEIPGDNTGVLTVPANATVAFPIGSYIDGSGFNGTMLAAGGVTITGTRGDLVVSGSFTLKKTGTNTWTLYNGEPDASTTVKGLVELATDAEVVTGTDTVRAATPSGVKAAIDALIAAAPGALNTLDELAAALGDDANFASTVTTALAGKAALAGSKVIQIAVSDETTPLTTGTNKVKFRMPYAMTLTAVRASLSTAQASGSNLVTVDINEGGTTILSTKITIDNTEKTSTTAATAAVISDTALADDAEITIDIDNVEAGTVAAGLKVTLIGS